MTWPPPPIPPEERARLRKLEGYKRVVRALRKEHERQESMTISILDDDGRPDPDRVQVNRMLDRFARDNGDAMPAMPAAPSASINTSTSSSFNLDDLKALVDRVAEMERTRDKRVFRFRGTLAQFQAALWREGIPVGPALALPGWPQMSVPGGLLSGLPCYEWGDEVYLGDDRDVLPILEAMERGEDVSGRVCEIEHKGGDPR